MAVWDWIGAALVVGLLMVMFRAQFTRGGMRRTAPAVIEPHGIAPRLRVAASGSFEWYPAGQPMAYVPGVALPVHRWWDTERGARYDVRVVFEILDEVAPDLLLAATKRALKTARRALPGRGRVRASAAHRDDPGPTGTVSVRLAVQGIGADPSWARAAAEAFAREFLVVLGRRGYEAERRA